MGVGLRAAGGRCFGSTGFLVGSSLLSWGLWEMESLVGSCSFAGACLVGSWGLAGDLGGCSDLGFDSLGSSLFLGSVGVMAEGRDVDAEWLASLTGRGCSSGREVSLCGDFSPTGWAEAGCEITVASMALASAVAAADDLRLRLRVRFFLAGAGCSPSAPTGVVPGVVITSPTAGVAPLGLVCATGLAPLSIGH